MAGIPVFMYHKISPNSSPGASEKMRLTPEKFDKEMHYLYRKGYQAIAPGELVDYCQGKLPGERKKIIISFDDGYRDNFTYAFPILQKYKFKAIIFLVSGLMESSSKWDESGPEPLMSWEEARKMQEEGIIFGSHGHNHRLLPSLSREEAMHEIAASKVLIEKKLHQPIHFFSYPWGKFNQEVKDIVKECGYRGAFSTLPGKNKSGEDVFAFRRVLIRGYDTRFYFFLNLHLGRSRI